MLTQPAVKTSLAWSTVAQMGFMMMECGLGLFPLALLHLVAHSLYKAHSFLAAGGAVERIVAAQRPGPVAVPSVRAVGRAFLVALGLYAAIGVAFDIRDAPPQAIALGAILIFGVAYLIAQGLADAAPRVLTRRLVVFSLAASLGYFVLHALAPAADRGDAAAAARSEQPRLGFDDRRGRELRAGRRGASDVSVVVGTSRGRRPARPPEQRPLRQRRARPAARRLAA